MFGAGIPPAGRTRGWEFESRYDQEFSLLHVVQIGSGAHPASLSNGHRGLLTRGSSGRGVKLTTHLQLTSN
jgi:hypothetical protein